MYARRFLGCIFVVTILVLAGAFAIYQFGSRVLINQAIPHGHFEPAKPGSGPDYAQKSSWLARPGAADDPSQWLPPGISSSTGKAAVFYIHPTTYLKPDRWNAPLLAQGDTEFRTRLFVQSQASAFNGVGEIWAPRYRQAAYGAFLLNSDDAAKALDLAYSDVASAFAEFVRQSGERPIILAGHSQGALHLERLIREKIAGKPISSRIVAVYAVGWPISTVADLPSLGLPPCHAPEETGCILSWMSFGDPPNPDLILDQWKKTRGPGGERKQGDVLCVNPLTGAEGGSAPPQDNPGTLLPGTNLVSATLQAHIVGAHCDKGLLILDGAVPPLGPYVLPGTNYHVYDYALFWGAIRQDAERRLSAWHP